MNLRYLIIALTVVLLYVSIYDLLYKKIPNSVPLIITASGVAYNYSLIGGVGLTTSLYGMLTGFMVTLLFYRIAALGAGDIKLIAAIGSVVGYQMILLVISYSYVVSAILGLIYIRFWIPRYQFRMAESSSPKPHTWLKQSIPMAPGISLVTLYVLYFIPF